jgi:MerR family transcriptional regulator/heat shock protein HspR
MDFERQAVYVISVAAELAGMHPQTLRIYERRGLVQPARTAGGKQRRYSNADIAQLLRIAQLTEIGMNLEGIRQVMALEIEVAELKNQVQLLQDQLAQSTADTSTRFGLVPLRQAVAVFGSRPSIFDKDR